MGLADGVAWERDYGAFETQHAIAEDKRKRAGAYCMAAEWHDKQATACRDMANDSPRLSDDIRAKAAANAVHHGASAAGLRLAATELLRRL